MSTVSWQVKLEKLINRSKRVAVIGVGQTLRGDDAVGIELVAMLKHLLPHSPSHLLYVAGSAPENMTGVLRKFRPDLVLFVDAADMQAKPGTIRLLDAAEMHESSFSTHTQPLSLLARYLKHELGCEVRMIGIQSVQTELGKSLSRPVRASMHRLCDFLEQALSDELAHH